jgi:branched-chain amino acid transport system substrate-binding protein
MEKKENRRNKGLTRRQFVIGSSLTVAGAATGISGVFNIAKGASPPIKVGIILPYTGGTADEARRVETGIRFAFARSKYSDRVEFHIEDDRETPSVGVEKAQKLVEKVGVDMLAGPIHGHVGLAVSEYCKSKKKLCLLAFSGNVLIAGKNCSRYTFMVGHTTWSVSAPGAPYCFERFGKKVYLIGNDYSTGRQITGFMAAEFKRLGGSIIGEGYMPIGTGEYAPYIGQIRDLKPDVVTGFLTPSDCLNFTKQFDSFGLRKAGIPIVMCLGMYGQMPLEGYGDSILGHYDIWHYSPWLKNKENLEFKRDFAKWKPGYPFMDALILGNDVGTCMIYGLDKVGDKPDTERMVDAIAKREWLSPRGKSSFGPNHAIIHDLYIRQAQKVEGETRMIPVKELGRFGTSGDASGPGGECKM